MNTHHNKIRSIIAKLFFFKCLTICTWSIKTRIFIYTTKNKKENLKLKIYIYFLSFLLILSPKKCIWENSCSGWPELAPLSKADRRVPALTLTSIQYLCESSGQRPGCLQRFSWVGASGASFFLPRLQPRQTGGKSGSGTRQTVLILSVVF